MAEACRQRSLVAFEPLQIERVQGTLGVPAERGEGAADRLAFEVHQIDQDPRGGPAGFQGHFGEGRAQCPDHVVVFGCIQLAESRQQIVRPPASDDDGLARRDEIAQLLTDRPPQAVGAFRPVQDVAVVDDDDADAEVVEGRPFRACRATASPGDQGDAESRGEALQQVVAALDGAVVQRPRVGVRQKQHTERVLHDRPAPPPSCRPACLDAPAAYPARMCRGRAFGLNRVHIKYSAPAAISFIASGIRRCWTSSRRFQYQCRANMPRSSGLIRQPFV